MKYTKLTKIIPLLCSLLLSACNAGNTDNRETVTNAGNTDNRETVTNAVKLSEDVAQELNQDQDQAQAQDQEYDAEKGVYTTRFRLIDDYGKMILAKEGGGKYDVYTLDISNDVDITMEGISSEEMAARDVAFISGGMLDITYTGIEDIFPGILCGVSEVCMLNNFQDSTLIFDDRCQLYMDVLEDLWNVDGALNEDITVIGVDLSKTSLTPPEQSALAYAFGQRHNLYAVSATYEELLEEGYITEEPVNPNNPDAKFPYWENGCLFSITEDQAEEFYEAPLSIITNGKSDVINSVHFDAEKWRSGLGAYIFMDCTAFQNTYGHWGEYTMGGAAIS